MQSLDDLQKYMDERLNRIENRFDKRFDRLDDKFHSLKIKVAAFSSMIAATIGVSLDAVLHKLGIK